ncbi:MAG: prolipoprotein diacylglyceryl transferase [Acidimicrobiales bacterium]
MVAFIPSPSSGALHLGPLQLRAYGLCIALGVWAAVTVCSRRYARRGGNGDLITTIAIWAVPAGIVGARLYHVVTDYELYLPPDGHPLNALKIWDGGLGIWGGVAAGVLVGAAVARRHGASVPVLLDCVAPALPLAQAIGRWGNYFNQELFGKPTSLPWALRIDAAHRPAVYAAAHTFQPIFLYESIWDLCVVGIVIWVGRHFRLRTGSLFAVYVAAYTFGRFFTEYERIDFAHRFGPLRLNDWVSIAVFTGALVVLAVTNRPTAKAAGRSLIEGDDRRVEGDDRGAGGDDLPAGGPTGVKLPR